jgi:hypothetical protein
MKAVKERGRISVDPKTGYEGGALLMDTAKGTSIKELVEQLPSDPALRQTEMKKLTAAMRRAAEGLAEMHAKFEAKGSGGAPVMMTREAKLDDANQLLDKNFRDGGDHVLQVKAVLGEADFRRVKNMMEGPMLRSFLDADVPATAYHGDANAGNFIVHDYAEGQGYKELGVIDVGSMKYSIGETGKATKTGAADVARLLGSIETMYPGKLTPVELAEQRERFMETYMANYRAVARRDLNLKKYRQAERWYRLSFEMMALKSDSSAKARILQILGLEGAP